jgi:hypothetical protein
VAEGLKITVAVGVPEGLKTWVAVGVTEGLKTAVAVGVPTADEVAVALGVATAEELINSASTLAVICCAVGFTCEVTGPHGLRSLNPHDHCTVLAENTVAPLAA